MSALCKLTDFVSSNDDQPGVTSSPVAALRDALPAIRSKLKANGLPEHSFGLDLITWQGPLQRVAHLRDQFGAISSPASSEAPDALHSEQELVPDLQLLCELAEVTKGLLYWFKGSESEYPVVPVIFKAKTSTSAAASVQDYWSSLQLGPELCTKLVEPQAFENKDDFIRYARESYLKHKDADAEDPDRHKLVEALKLLASRTEPIYAELIAGQDGMYNPIPIFWLGRSSTSGCLLGLMSLIVWT